MLLMTFFLFVRVKTCSSVFEDCRHWGLLGGAFLLMGGDRKKEQVKSDYYFYKLLLYAARWRCPEKRIMKWTKSRHL